MGDCLQVYHLCNIAAHHHGQLSLAIFPWVGKMSTGEGCSHHWGRNGGELCMTIDPVTRTGGILTQSSRLNYALAVNRAGHSIGRREEGKGEVSALKLHWKNPVCCWM